MGHPVRSGESVPSTVGELCFNFKRRRVLGPPASIPVTKCLRTRKYVPRCRNRSLFPLKRAPLLSTRSLFSPIPPRYRAHELTHSDAHLSPPFQFACAITQTKKKGKKQKREDFILYTVASRISLRSPKRKKKKKKSERIS